MTKALPAYTWLVDMARRSRPAHGARGGPAPAHKVLRHRQRPCRSAAAVVFELNGRTVDIQAYTRFLRQLEASPWITDVTPVSAPDGGREGAPGDRVHHPGHVPRRRTRRTSGPFPSASR